MPDQIPELDIESEADAQEKLERVRDRLESFDEFFWVFDVHADSFLYVGAAYTQIWGGARDAMMLDSSAFFEAIHPDDRARIRAAYRANSAGAYDEIYRVLGPDGDFRVVRDRAFPQLIGPHATGLRAFEHRVGLISDITDIADTHGFRIYGPSERDLPSDQRPTLQLDSNQKRYRALFLESADATLLVDGHGYIIQANHRAARLFGFERHELVRMHFSSLFSDDILASAVAAWEKVRSGHQLCRRVTTMLRKDGASIAVEVAAVLLYFGPEYTVQSTFRPVTSQSQINYELEAAREQLAQVQKMELIGQVAGGAAHDFNNLLSVIGGFAEVLKLRLKGHPEAQRDAEKILEAGESAALLVRRLLTLARHEAREPEVMEPEEPILHTCALLERALSRDIILKTQVAEDLWPIRIDRVELEQIIMNLGLNAGDAMPDGGVVELQASNFVNSPTTVNPPAKLVFGRYVRLRVRDSGVGMDEGIRARIFEPFFTTKPKSRGTGLGLATVKNLVSLNNGFLTVESEPAKGTTFDLYFPKSSFSQSNGASD